MSSKVKVYKTRNGATIKLVNEDSIKDLRKRVRKTIEEKSVDVIVTSPPYNLGIKYKGYDDTIQRDEYLHWMGIWAVAMRHVLKDSGSLFLNVGSKPSDPMVPYELLKTMHESAFHLQNVIHWIKSIAIMKNDVGNYPGITKDVVVGHYKPINSDRFLNDCHEFIFHLTKRGNALLDRLAIGVPYQDKSNVKRWANATEGLHCRGNTWFLPYKTIRHRKDRPHPATFPVELPTRCIQLHGIERTKLVLDPFMGIGTSAIACVDLDIDFVGYEISKDYFDVACERLSSPPYNLEIE